MGTYCVECNQKLIGATYSMACACGTDPYCNRCWEEANKPRIVFRKIKKTLYKKVGGRFVKVEVEAYRKIFMGVKGACSECAVKFTGECYTD